MSKSYNILIVGVGGQGVLLASEIISDVAIRANLDVKKSEVHGMSQRGGVVSSHVKIDKKGFIQPYNSKKFNILRRQDIEQLYFFEGSVYISLTDVLLDKESFYHERTLPYVVPRWKSLEIDELVDLIVAEALLKKKDLLNRQVFNE